MSNTPEVIYKKLYAHFGSQRWWPADTPFEVMIGAILTQNTNWQNVEKAIKNLKRHNLLVPERLRRVSVSKLSRCIRPSGYYNLKAKRLKSFLAFFFSSYKGRVGRMRKGSCAKLRKELLCVKGIGPETADSILLYALDKPVFVVDAYTRRIFSRHRLIEKDADYASIQSLFMRRLSRNAKLFNEYHALLVRLAKDVCLKNNPHCNICPLESLGKRGVYA